MRQMDLGRSWEGVVSEHHSEESVAVASHETPFSRKSTRFNLSVQRSTSPNEGGYRSLGHSQHWRPDDMGVINDLTKEGKVVE